MQYDYYAFQKDQLSDPLNQLEEALTELEQIKKQKNKNERQRLESRIEQSAEKAVEVEPHLSCLWYEAQDSELKNSIRDAWQKHLNATTIPDAFGFTPSLSKLENLPFLSFMLRVPFKLQKPYLSKDDRTFHLLDNPVRKDKVFQTPMVASTSWKGALRAALWQLEHQKEDEQIIRLFGDAREDEKGQAGRLYFYPTFFDKLGLEVINPHDRKTGTGKNPILIECVPLGTTGELVILYVPFGKVQESEVAADLQLLAEGVQAMLTVYGFGAKTSSGFGIADQQGIGQIAIKYPYSLRRSQLPQKPEYPEKLRLFLEQYPNEDFQRKPKEWRKLHNASQSQQSSYAEARKAQSTYQEELKAYESELVKWKTEANAPPLPQRTENFNTLVEMVAKVSQIAEHLCQVKEISHEL